METTYRVSADNTGEITAHQRWKALTGQGRAGISQIQIPYIPTFQDVEIKFVKTLKKDGTVVNGDPASAVDTAPSADPLTATFTDVKTKVMLPPNLETGDSIEYEAVVHIRKWMKPGDFWFIHYLTTNVPVLSETVVLDLPADRKVAFMESSAIPGKTEILNGRRIERWMASNPEPAKATFERAPPLFAVSSLLSWAAFGDWIYALNKNAVEPTPEIATLAAQLTAGKSSEPERIAALYAYVASKVRYVGVSLGVGRIQPHAASMVLHNAYGDCKDQTALLSAFLESAGFKTHRILTTPWVGVHVPDVPEPDQFNHEFLAIETKSGLAFLDTSMGPVSPQTLQPGVRGRRALLIGEGNSSIIDIPIQSPVAQRVIETLRGKVNGAGAFEGSARFEFQGLLEAFVRRSFLDATEEEKAKILLEFAGPELKEANVRQIANSDPGDLAKPFWMRCELSLKNFFPAEKTSIRVKFELPTAAIAGLETLEKPQKPIPIESFFATRSMDLMVDPSFTIETGMPVHIKTPFGAFDSEFTYHDSHLLLKRSIEFNGAAIAPTDWQPFVEFTRSIRAEIALGFGLERHVAHAYSGSHIGKSLRDGTEAYRNHDYEAAKTAYLEATKIDPRNVSAWNDLGRAYFALREYTKAEQAYKRQTEINPKDRNAFNNLGLVYRALKRDDEAIVWFRKQIAITPRDPRAHENLSETFAEEKDWQHASEEAAIAADIAPEDAARWYRLGKTQIRMGRIGEARTSFDRALAQVPDAMIENDIAYDMADAGMDLDKAWKLVSGTLNPEARGACQPETLSDSDKCSQALRRIAYMLDTAGWVLYRQGKLAEVEPYLWSSFAITPGAETEMHLSILLAKLGRFEESLKHFASARSRPKFSRLDLTEVRRELAIGAGGSAQLDRRLEQIKVPAASQGATARVIALVDERGKVTEAQAGDAQTPAEVIEAAKSLTLISISWLEHSLRSIRTIEFRQEGKKWSPCDSYVGQPAEPSSSSLN